MLIGIVDYGIGNILSVFNSIYNQGYDPIVVKEKKDFKKVDKLIIPGVGSAFKAMELLKKKDFYYCILDFYNSGKPILGICLGFQIFANKLYEDGNSEGLRIIDGSIKPISKKKSFNIGWCKVEIEKNFSMKIGLNKISDFYFCHSYFLEFNSIEEKKFCLGHTSIDKKIPSIFVKNNFLGTQFHPEKSQQNGIKFLKFFLTWNPEIIT